MINQPNLMQDLKTENETNTKDALTVFNCIFNSQ